MATRYINPYTDFGFKRLFGTEENKELLISFLNAMIYNEDGIITDVVYKNVEQLADIKEHRNCYFDVYCMTKDGARFIVEMQNARQNLYLEMAKLKGKNLKLDTFRDKWLYALQTIGYTCDYPEVFKEGVFPKLFEAAALAGLTEDELLEHERSQKAMWDRINERNTARQEGLEEGRAEGRAEGQAEGETVALTRIAQKMKAEGMDAETIYRLTGIQP